MHCCFFLRKGKNLFSRARKICEVGGVGAVSDDTVRRWFKKFQEGECSLKDDERAGRPSIVDDNLLRATMTENPRFSLQEMSGKINIPKHTRHDCLKKLGYVSLYNVWVSHKLSEGNLTARLSACDSLFKRNKEVPFLKKSSQEMKSGSFTPMLCTRSLPCE